MAGDRGDEVRRAWDDFVRGGGGGRQPGEFQPLRTGQAADVDAEAGFGSVFGKVGGILDLNDGWS